MKVGRDYSWGVEYTWDYEYFNEETEEWENDCYCDSRRFNCIKKEIKKNVTEYIKKNELNDIKYRNLEVIINDSYITSTVEL